MQDYLREPCPWRIVEDTGSAFSLGVIGGSIFHTCKGFRNSPSGLTNRLRGSFNAIRSRAPITGGGFAMWGFVYTAVDCSLAQVRKKEDPLNSIASGVLTGSILLVRQGPLSMIGAGFAGGVIMGIIEGVMFAMSRQPTPAYMYDSMDGQPLNAPQGYLGH